MKLAADQILINKKIDYVKKIYLITGNEESLVKGVEKKLLSSFKVDSEIEIFVKEGGKLNDAAVFETEASLFSKSKIILYRNPKEIDLKSLENINFENTVIIITDMSLKNSSGIKKKFDSHPDYYSISCYKITRAFKKSFADDFIKKNSINFDSNAYWFFLDNSSSIFGLFESELIKISNYGGEKILLSEIKLLLSVDQNVSEIEELFLGQYTQEKIINKSLNIIKSSSEVYVLIQKIKFYLDLVISSENRDELQRNFPKYLFLQEKKFYSIYEKLNTRKIINILALLKKTEIMLRKNDSMFLPISQRLLLNIRKNIG